MKTRKSALALAIGLLLTIFFDVFLHSAVFILHGKMSQLVTIMALLISLAMAYIVGKKLDIKRPYLIPVILFATLAISIFLGSITLDTTYDGNTYHKQAIGSLKDGWNPVYNDIGNLFSNTYPKASWIFAGSIYQLTGNIESGKAINFIILAITFFAAYWYIGIRLSREKSALTALLLALSPVATMQLFSNYVDGIMGSLLVVLTIFLNALVDKKVKTPRIYLYSTIVILIVIICNLKFTGIVYAGIIAVIYLLYVIWKRNWHMMRQLVLVGSASLMLAIGVVGASPYIRNFVVHGQPLYPLMGNGSVDIMKNNMPASYAHKNRVYKFLESNFGETDNKSYSRTLNDGGQVDSKLKIPFTFNLEEVQLLSYNYPDLRQAGYGVWFGGILLVSGVAALYILLKNRHIVRKEDLPLILLPIVPIILTALATDAAWWARYLPQLIIFPILILVLLYVGKSKLLASLLSFALLFNITLIFVLAVSYQLQNVKPINDRIRSLVTCNVEKPPQEIIVTKYFDSYFMGSTYNMLDICSNLKIKYAVSVDDMDYTEIWNGIYIKNHT